MFTNNKIYTIREYKLLGTAIWRLLFEYRSNFKYQAMTDDTLIYTPLKEIIYECNPYGRLIEEQIGKEITETDIYEVYGADGIVGYSSNFMFDDSEKYIQMIQRGSSAGNVFLRGQTPSSISSTSLAFKVLPNYSVDYIFLVLQTLNFSQYMTASIFPDIKFMAIENVGIYVPHIDKQLYIVEGLKRLVDVINGEGGEDE